MPLPTATVHLAYRLGRKLRQIRTITVGPAPARAPNPALSDQSESDRGSIMSATNADRAGTWQEEGRQPDRRDGSGAGSESQEPSFQKILKAQKQPPNGRKEP